MADPMTRFEMLPYLLCTLMLVIGVYAVVAKKNLIKVIVGVAVVEYAVNTFLILQGYRAGGIPPILTPGMSERSFIARTVDPLPQALILTSIVIGLGILVLMVSIAIRLYEKYGTFDLSKIRRLRG